jgi:hypothetical protein
LISKNWFSKTRNNQAKQVTCARNFNATPEVSFRSPSSCHGNEAMATNTEAEGDTTTFNTHFDEVDDDIMTQALDILMETLHSDEQVATGAESAELELCSAMDEMTAVSSEEGQETLVDPPGEGTGLGVINMSMLDTETLAADVTLSEGGASMVINNHQKAYNSDASLLNDEFEVDTNAIEAPKNNSLDSCELGPAGRAVEQGGSSVHRAESVDSPQDSVVDSVVAMSCGACSMELDATSMESDAPSMDRPLNANVPKVKFSLLDDESDVLEVMLQQQQEDEDNLLAEKAAERELENARKIQYLATIRSQCPLPHVATPIMQYSDLYCSTDVVGEQEIVSECAGPTQKLVKNNPLYTALEAPRDDDSKRTHKPPLTQQPQPQPTQQNKPPPPQQHHNNSHNNNSRNGGNRQSNKRKVAACDLAMYGSGGGDGGNKFANAYVRCAKY